MIKDTQSIPDGGTINADICIIGSGPGAFSVALQFVDGAPSSKPLKVVMLESEPSEDPRAMFALAQDQNLGPCDVTDNLYPGVQKGFLSDRSGNYLAGGFWGGRLRVYGGTSRHWGGWDWTLQPWDLGGRPFHQGLAWPVDFQELNHYYGLVYQDIMQLNYLKFDDPQFWIDTYPDQHLAEMPIPSGSPLKTRILQFQSIAFQQQYGGRIASSQYVDLYQNANALNFVTTSDASGQKTASQLQVGSLDTSTCTPSKTWNVAADRYVVCCGGIESTRLLLLNDLGNQGGKLGLTFMDNPYMNPGARFTLNSSIPQGVSNFYFPYSAIPGGAPCYSTFVAGLVPTEEYLDANPEIGDFRILLGAVGSPGGTYINTEQAPPANSVVSLATPEEKPVDWFGQRRVKVDWQSLQLPNGSYPDTETLRRTIDLARELLQDQLGYISNYQPTDPNYASKEWWQWTNSNGGLLVGPGLHPQGSTRMSADPGDGVVDANLRVHDAGNVYVNASSNFPTQGYQNPTFAVCAMGKRLADHFLAG